MTSPILQSTHVAHQAELIPLVSARPRGTETLSRARSYAYDVVEEWHRDEQHVGRFDHCHQQPCHAIHMAS